MGHARPWLAVLDFWFRELTPAQWFEGGDDIDKTIRDRFAERVDQALAGTLDDWAATPRGRLALVILIDQFTRNVFRGEARAFSGDDKAQKLVLAGLDLAADKALTLSERQFFYMPLMHAEDLALQDRSVALFAALEAEVAGIHAFARGHHNVVARHGRFPMRNAARARADTEAEKAYLRDGGGYPVDGERLG
ncbi:DUF924 family protein [Croceicoccus sp. BE223]|uniref:DUF924 family protein n=1 Tax=Croceicoccus sp. BE223 TaxID=2817716 RepID=UPI00286049B7|nr:DUF924 family protein [Croceicoccus sp. BE223]MDR7104000.1 uncharacterized protein (DUF924 family) [Croceicoccus sp. BE223]